MDCLSQPLSFLQSFNCQFQIRKINLRTLMINFSQMNRSAQIISYEDSMHRNSQFEDPIDRAAKHLRNIIQENDKLEQQINELRVNPKTFIQPLKNEIILKINQLQLENGKLKKMVGQSKMPAYSQMKRKSFVPNQNAERDSMKSSMRQSLRNSITARSALSEVNSNSNFNKNEVASTCFNEQQKYQTTQRINPILKLQKPSQSQQQERQRLTKEIHYLIAKTQIFQRTVSQMNAKQEKQCERNVAKIVNQESELTRIQEYKKKLLRLLNKLKSREVQMNQMVKMYKMLHEQTIKKLKESSEALKLLQQQKIDEDIQKKYAEVLQLEHRLEIINIELQQMDEQKWLQKVYKELSIVFRRLGIPIPKCDSVHSAIDQLCQILIEHHLMSKHEGVQKLNKLKQYNQQQKQNNQRLLQGLKAKEQLLNKKLNTIQMQKGSNTKK